ncbi:protein kinase domain-containing protein [Colletotrichum scovillei]|uniref:protein kinase domain-containing protein n=1 Tax=Colletotrichum scovillei TaxID=1209932 RepID=UPI0015C3AC30|nr:protein kinase domain-containing protein [Colletotrichum scovillei]KAF4773455.1 protein kinase domain-containing protein [Colletotrichum scovillei]
MTESARWEYANKICPGTGSVGARSVFAILTLLGNINEIIEFLNNGLTDTALPFVRNTTVNEVNGRLFPQGLSDQTLENWHFGSQWQLKDWTAFDAFQKRMGSPFFVLQRDQDLIPHYELEKHTVLPFTTDEGPEEKSWFSKVRRVQIHRGHRTIAKNETERNPYFAVKELLRIEQKEKTSDQIINLPEEVRALTKTLGHSSHDHVVQLLATWRQGERWSMLFPWAKCNLKDYWRNTEPKNTPEFVQWIATQCRGIAQGLQKIHRKPSNHAQDFGIHGDIKPENLLLFESPRYPEGILVISDFGFTRFHCRDTRSNTSFIGWSPTHCAPEVQLGKKISRSYDIWTLGCVYVEFATWYLTGSKGVGDEFVRRRLQDDQVGPSGIRYDKFFNVHLTSEGRQKPELKDSVQKDFLCFILDRMLRVDSKSRAGSDQVAAELKALELLCSNNNTEYLSRQHSPRLSASSSSQTSFLEDQSARSESFNVNACTPQTFQTWCSQSDFGSDHPVKEADRRRSIVNMDEVMAMGMATFSETISNMPQIGGEDVIPEVPQSVVTMQCKCRHAGVKVPTLTAMEDNYAIALSPMYNRLKRCL